MATQRNYAQQMDAVLAGLGGTRPRLLLHACCGPCSSAVLEQLCRYFEITVLYYNPNTWPAAEYYRRGEELQKFVAGTPPPGGGRAGGVFAPLPFRKGHFLIGFHMRSPSFPIVPCPDGPAGISIPHNPGKGKY